MTAMTRSRSAARKSFLHAVFVTALEGGIGYWCEASHYHWMKDEFTGVGGYPNDCEDVDGFYAIIEPPSYEGHWGFFDSDDNRSLRIDAAVIARGITRFVKLYTPILAKQPDDYWHQFLLANRTNGAKGDYDASVADVVVQLGLFDQVVYA